MRQTYKSKRISFTLLNLPSKFTNAHNLHSKSDCY